MEYVTIFALIGGVIWAFFGNFDFGSNEKNSDDLNAAFEGLRNQHKKLEDYVSYRVNLISQDNLTTLSQNRERLRFKNEYGNLEMKRWSDHVEKFASQNLFKSGHDFEDLQGAINQYNSWHSLSGGITSFIKSEIDRRLDSQPKCTQDMVPIDPIQYEHYVAQKLRDGGWDAHVTTASGDQGADIVATRNGVKLVVQCKRYGSAIGNSAVQEVIAAMKYYHAEKGAVVSNQTYTRSARSLASVSGVELMHHENLHRI